MRLNQRQGCCACWYYYSGDRRRSGFLGFSGHGWTIFDEGLLGYGCGCVGPDSQQTWRQKIVWEASAFPALCEGINDNVQTGTWAADIDVCHPDGVDIKFDALGKVDSLTWGFDAIIIWVDGFRVLQGQSQPLSSPNCEGVNVHKCKVMHLNQGTHRISVLYSTGDNKWTGSDFYWDLEITVACGVVLECPGGINDGLGDPDPPYTDPDDGPGPGDGGGGGEEDPIDPPGPPGPPRFIDGPCCDGITCQVDAALVDILDYPAAASCLDGLGNSVHFDYAQLNGSYLLTYEAPYPNPVTGPYHLYSITFGELCAELEEDRGFLVADYASGIRRYFYKLNLIIGCRPVDPVTFGTDIDEVMWWDFFDTFEGQELAFCLADASDNIPEFFRVDAGYTPVEGCSPGEIPYTLSAADHTECLGTGYEVHANVQLITSSREC